VDDTDPPIALTEAEVRGVVRLLAEALTPDDGRPAKVGRLMGGLCGMIDADGWVWVRSRVDAALEKPINLDYLYGGVSSQQVAALAQRMLAMDGRGAEFAALAPLYAGGEAYSATRRQLADDRAWRDDPTMQPVRASGLDEVMYSWFPFADGQGATIWSGVWFFRTLSRPPFDARACRIVHRIVVESGPLHVDGLTLAAEPVLRTLTPKQRLVLTQMVDSNSTRQIADHLGLSPHTVNDHIKAIYRHFDVQSRAELMRRFLHTDCGLGGAA